MAPWVVALARRAKLAKERVSLSFLLLGRDGGRAGTEEWARIVSDEFALDGERADGV